LRALRVVSQVMRRACLVSNKNERIAKPESIKTHNRRANQPRPRDAMIKPEHCVKEEALVLMVEAGGLEEVRIAQTDNTSFLMSVKMKTKRERYYLATRRNPDEPRQFKSIEAAVAVGEKLFGATRFTVITIKSRSD
jgi:hypothetical protein